MARAPTELGRIIGNKNAKGIYTALKKNRCLTAEGLSNRKQIVEALALKLAYPPSGWRFSGVNERGQPVGPMVPDLGGRTLHDEFLEVLVPYLNEKGERTREHNRGSFAGQKTVVADLEVTETTNPGIERN
jgi:hypothetical protein